MDLTIACTLTAVELAERRKNVVDSLLAKAVETLPIQNGMSHVFKGEPGLLAQIAELVWLEHQCCAFLTFKIIVEAGKDNVVLEITGPAEAAEVLGQYFGPTR